MAKKQNTFTDLIADVRRQLSDEGIRISEAPTLFNLAWWPSSPPTAAGRAVEEYLATLDDAAFGAATQVPPKFIAPADPATRWAAAHRGPAFFAYSNNYLIDIDNAIIVDVEMSGISARETERAG